MLFLYWEWPPFFVVPHRLRRMVLPPSLRKAVVTSPARSMRSMPSARLTPGVLPKHRNQSIGRTLLAQVKTDFSNLAVYTLSDEDAYYEKIGYKKIGSVFEL